MVGVLNALPKEVRISKDRLEQLMARRKRKSISSIAAGFRRERLLLRRGRREAKSEESG